MSDNLKGTVIYLSRFSCKGHMKKLENQKKHPDAPHIASHDIYSVLGYHSSLTTVSFDGIDNFSPNSDIIKCDCHSTKEDYECRYKIKLFRSTVFDKLIEDMSCESLFCEREAHIADLPGDSGNDKPLLSVILLDLKRDAIKRENADEEITKRLMEAVRKAAEEAEEENSSAKALFDIQNSIGTADYAILCRSNNFYTPLKLLYDLREQDGFVSSSVLVPAIKNVATAKESWKTCSLDKAKAVSLSIRMNLTDTSKIEEVTRVLIKYFYIHMASGHSDIILHSKKDIWEYTDMYVNGQDKTLLELLKSGWISSMRTTLNLKKDGIQHVKRIELGEYKDGSETAVHCKILEGMNEAFGCDLNGKSVKGHNYFLKKHGIMISCSRLQKGYSELLRYYFDFAEKDHNFDVNCMLTPFLDNMFKLVKGVYEGIPERETIEKINNDLNELRSKLRHITHDFAKADGKWAEGKVLSHQAMGAAKKIIMAYYSILIQMAKNLGVDTEKTTFLLTSGGVDEIKAKTWFAHMHEERKIATIQMPESHLYRVRDSVFRMTHELFHLIALPEELANLRMKYTIKYIANELAYKIFTEAIEPNADINYPSNPTLHNGPTIAQEFKKETIECIAEYLHDIFKKEQMSLHLDKQKDYASQVGLYIKLLSGIFAGHITDSNNKTSIIDEFITRGNEFVTNSYPMVSLDYEKVKDEIRKYTDTIHKDIIYNRRDNLAQIVADLFVESFSDSLAISVLGFDLQRYLDHITNYMSEDKAEFEIIFPDNDLSILRIGTVLTNMFNFNKKDIEEKFDDIKQKLQNRLDDIRKDIASEKAKDEDDKRILVQMEKLEERIKNKLDGKEYGKAIITQYMVDYGAHQTNRGFEATGRNIIDCFIQAGIEHYKKTTNKSSFFKELKEFMLPEHKCHNEIISYMLDRWRELSDPSSI
ncbi:MAG: hypothetical protein FWH04_08215 [Oscillospiraceae bacterium]|nr:hypothetical protein [Oscillospiraceae bacterium]